MAPKVSLVTDTAREPHPRDELALVVGHAGLLPLLTSPILDAVQTEFKVSVSHSAGPGLLCMVTDLTDGQGASGCLAAFDLGLQRRPKADPEVRVSLLTCVGTAGFDFLWKLPCQAVGRFLGCLVPLVVGMLAGPLAGASGLEMSALVRWWG